MDAADWSTERLGSPSFGRRMVWSKMNVLTAPVLSNLFNLCPNGMRRSNLRVLEKLIGLCVVLGLDTLLIVESLFLACVGVNGEAMRVESVLLLTACNVMDDGLLWLGQPLVCLWLAKD